MKKLGFLVITAIFFTLPSLCGAMDFQPLNPDTAARIEALKQAVKQEGGTYEIGYSAAMDKPIKHLTGLKVPPGWNKSDAPSVAMLRSNVQTLPSSYDWRTLNGVTPIKNQGNCGSCWAFATVAPFESQILIQGGGTVPLAEQYLVSCNTSGWSCNGGWFAHDYHMNESGQDNNGPGAVLNANDPYTSGNGTDARCSATYNHPYKLSAWSYVASEDAAPSINDIKQAIYTYGPIAAGVYVGSKFQAYNGGIFNTNETGTINHAITLVGWNDDLGPNNGYWILRNSWGSSWGESGYMRIRYGISQVGYAANFIEYAGGTPSPNPPPAPPVVSLPNLTGQFVNISTSYSGRALSGNLWVENLGTAATANSFRVLLYLSTNGVAKTTLLGSATISTVIPPGYYVNLRISAQSSTSFNGKYLIAVIDPDDSVPDSNRSNSVVVSNMIQKR